MSYGLYAYGLAGGAAAMIAVVFVLLSVQRPATRGIQLSIAFLAGVGSASVFVHAQLQSAQNIDEYAATIKGPIAVIGLLTLLAYVWTIGVSTNVAYPGVPMALTLATVGVGVVNMLTPNGLLVDEVTGLREVSLFGDTFVLHEPNRSPWRIVLDIYLLAVAAYALAAVVHRVRRRGQLALSPSSIYTWVGLGLALTLGLYDSLVDEALVDTPYLAPFGVVGLALGLALAHTERVAETERRLVTQSTELEAMVRERTGALADAHNRMVDQLEQQRQAAEHLARTTHQFVVLNNVALIPGQDGGFQHAVEGVIGCVGDVVSADRLRLDLQESVASTFRSSPVSWQADDRDEHAENPATVMERPLRIGDLSLGRLTITWTTEPDLTDQQLQMIGLTTDYLAAVLHRLDIQGSLVVDAVTSERERIARELHDSVSQRLYAAAFNADFLTASVGNEPAQAVEKAKEIRTLVLLAVSEMRTLLFELQPKLLETANLKGLLIDLCESIGASHHQPIAVIAQDGPPLPPDPKMAIYRITQEAVGNALRHADADSITVVIDIDDEGVDLRVEDDGLGFQREAVLGGYGLHTMAERAEQIGAKLDVTSNPGEGTTVSLWWRFEHGHGSGRPRHLRSVRHPSAIFGSPG